MKALLLAALCSLMVTGGQILWKYGLNRLSIADFFSIKSLSNILLSPFIMTGFAVYIGATILWLYLLNNYRLSFIYPLISMTYIFSLILANLVLKESIPVVRWIGVFVIIIGILLISHE